jgi:hypothetical protein
VGSCLARWRRSRQRVLPGGSGGPVSHCRRATIAIGESFSRSYDYGDARSTLREGGEEEARREGERNEAATPGGCEREWREEEREEEEEREGEEA